MSESPQINDPRMASESRNEIPLADQIWGALEKSKGRENVNQTRKSRQKEIIDKLPTDLETEIRAFASYTEMIVQEPLRKQVAGEMFEQLVRADTNICPNDETVVAKLIRSMMKNPAHYRLEEYGLGESVRQPDIAQVDEKGKIIGAVEIKATQVDQRASDQIGNFRENIIKVVNSLQRIKVNNAHLLENHGLKEIAENPNKLEVADNFSVTLAVPYDTCSGVPELLIEETGFESDGDIDEAVDRLKNCRIIESPFSRDDLGVITDCVSSWLESKRT